MSFDSHNQNEGVWLSELCPVRRIEGFDSPSMGGNGSLFMCGGCSKSFSMFVDDSLDFKTWSALGNFSTEALSFLSGVDFESLRCSILSSLIDYTGRFNTMEVVVTSTGPDLVPDKVKHHSRQLLASNDDPTCHMFRQDTGSWCMKSSNSGRFVLIYDVKEGGIMKKYQEGKEMVKLSGYYESCISPIGMQFDGSQFTGWISSQSETRCWHQVDSEGGEMPYSSRTEMIEKAGKILKYVLIDHILTSITLFLIVCLSLKIFGLLGGDLATCLKSCCVCITNGCKSGDKVPNKHDVSVEVSDKGRDAYYEHMLGHPEERRSSLYMDDSGVISDRPPSDEAETSPRASSRSKRAKTMRGTPTPLAKAGLIGTMMSGVPMTKSQAPPYSHPHSGSGGTGAANGQGGVTHLPPNHPCDTMVTYSVPYSSCPISNDNVTCSVNTASRVALTGSPHKFCFVGTDGVAVGSVRTEVEVSSLIYLAEYMTLGYVESLQSFTIREQMWKEDSADHMCGPVPPTKLARLHPHDVFNGTRAMMGCWGDHGTKVGLGKEKDCDGLNPNFPLDTRYGLGAIQARGFDYSNLFVSGNTHFASDCLKWFHPSIESNSPWSSEWWCVVYARLLLPSMASGNQANTGPHYRVSINRVVRWVPHVKVTTRLVDTNGVVEHESVGVATSLSDFNAQMGGHSVHLEVDSDQEQGGQYFAQGYYSEMGTANIDDPDFYTSIYYLTQQDYEAIGLLCPKPYSEMIIKGMNVARCHVKGFETAVVSETIDFPIREPFPELSKQRMPYDWGGRQYEIAHFQNSDPTGMANFSKTSTMSMFIGSEKLGATIDMSGSLQALYPVVKPVLTDYSKMTGICKSGTFGAMMTFTAHSSMESGYVKVEIPGVGLMCNQSDIYLEKLDHNFTLHCMASDCTVISVVQLTGTHSNAIMHVVGTLVLHEAFKDTTFKDGDGDSRIIHTSKSSDGSHKFNFLGIPYHKVYYWLRGALPAWLSWILTALLVLVVTLVEMAAICLFVMCIYWVLKLWLPIIMHKIQEINSNVRDMNRRAVRSMETDEVVPIAEKNSSGIGMHNTPDPRRSSVVKKPYKFFAGA
jgi:hypothetical protein